MTTNQILVAARALIEKPEHWRQGNYAMSADGKWVNPEDARAISFCSVGAIRRASDTIAGQQCEALDVLQRVIPSASIAQFNDADNRTHAEVLAAFDRAIEATKEQP